MKTPTIEVIDGTTVAVYHYEGGYKRDGRCFFSANPNHFMVYGAKSVEDQPQYHRMNCVACNMPVYKGMYADSSGGEYAAVVICADCLLNEAVTL